MDAPSSLIEQRFGQRLGTAVTLLERHVASEGYSDETGVLTFRTAENRQLRVVVRLFRAGVMARHEVDPQRLHKLLTVLTDVDIPSPPALWFDSAPEVFGSPYSVVSWVSGQAVVPWSREGRAMLAEAGRGHIGEQFPAALADIHALDWCGLGIDFIHDPGPGRAFSAECVQEVTSYLGRVGDQPEPILTDALGWLRANLPATERVCLLHGDYRTGNLLFEKDRISAILDWEFARIGDPMFDVGWVCAPSNNVGSELVSMILPEDEFLDRYAKHSGHSVDRSALLFWKVFHQVRHAVMWIDAGHRFARGDTDDLRLARMHYTLPRMRQLVADLLEPL